MSESTSAPRAPDAAAPSKAQMAAIAILAVTALLVICAYAVALDAPYLFDDEHDIVSTPELHVLWPPAWLHASHRPLTTATFALSWWMGDGAPWAFRAFNLGVHLCASVALFLAARGVLSVPRIGLGDDRATLLAAATTLLWAVHPLHTSAVTYVVHRYESLAGVFYFLTVAAFVEGARRSPGRAGLFVAAAIACACGSLAKETLVTAPLVALMIDAALVAEGLGDALRKRWRAHLGLWLALAPMVAIALSQPIGGSQKYDPAKLSRGAYLLSEASAVARYLKLSVVPAPLSIDYYDWPITRSLAALSWTSWLVIALAAGSFVALVRSRSRPALAIVVFLVMLAPTSSLIPLQHELVAERRMYIALAPLTLLAVYAAAQMSAGSRARGVAAGAALAAAALALSFVTLSRNVLYTSPLAIYAHDTAARPENARAHAWYAYYLEAADRVADAEAHVRAAFALDPDTPRLERIAMLVADRTGKREEAARWAMIALAKEPNDEGAEWIAATHLASTGRASEAARVLEVAVKTNPTAVKLHDAQAWLLATEDTLRDGPRAVAASDRAFANLQGGPPPTLIETRAAALAARGDYAAAVAMIGPVAEGARAAGATEAAKRFDAEAAAYRAGRPWSRAEQTRLGL